MFSSLRAAVVAVLVLALGACANLTGTGDPNVAASVNGTDIPISEVEERFEQAKAQPQVAQQLEQDPDGAYEANIQAQILSQLVVAQLLEQWADDLGVEATEEEIDEERTELIEQIGGQEAFEQAVTESGLSEEDVDAQIRQRVLQNEIAAEVGSEEEVSDEEIETFYEENQDARFGEKATARHILVERKPLADRIVKELRAGGDFAELAEQESQDPGSAAEGGELPEFGRGQMVPQFEEAVFSAEPGELVGPVKTDFGFHVIEVLDRRPGQDLDEVRDEIRDELAETHGGEELQAELTKRTEEAEVTVNPRFGTWNASTGQVEPEQPLGTSSEVPGAGDPAPAGSEAPLPPTESATE